MAPSLTLPKDVFKHEGRWYRECPSCGGPVSHARRNYCINASLIKQPCITCSNKTNHPAGMVGSVRVSWFNAFYKSAITRGYVWDITPEFVDAMYDEQDGRCVYSGLPISWSVTGWDHTASIDRIDNDKGYTEENVQLVHKDVNMMRGTLDDETFKMLCTRIADKVKW